VVLILNREVVEKVLKMSDCIDAVEKAFGELASNKAVMPLRPTINVDEYEGVSLYMPAYLMEKGSLACKIVTVRPIGTGTLLQADTIIGSLRSQGIDDTSLLVSEAFKMELLPQLEDISKSQFDSLRRLLDSRGLIDEKLETVLRDIFRDCY